MGAGDADAVSEKKEDVAIKKNLDEQSKQTGGAGGTGRRVTGGLSRFCRA